MKKNGGFIEMILIIIVVLVILGYFGFNIADVISTPTVQSNLNWAWNVVHILWSYISGPILYLWGLLVNVLTVLGSK